MNFINKNNTFTIITDRVLIVIATLCLIIISVGFFSISITGSKNYYQKQFIKNDTISQLTWNYYEDGEKKTISYDEDDLDIIITSIIDYLVFNKESMQVEIDGKEVFSKQAINHMADVKVLYQNGISIVLICLVIFIVLIIYFILRKQFIKPILFKYSLIAFFILFIFVAALGIWMLFDFDNAFIFFHHVIFPDPAKFNDAFFSSVSNYQEYPYINNLLLVTVLDTSVFMDAGFIIIIGSLLIYIIWMIISYLIKKKSLANC